ncbi:glycosyltransferase [Acidovorax sp.]|uniref:glycosyltransferase n=1 Tax=Acidovorax sp. TaxID=1872122 RepID=UPI00262B0DD6|nr:glycosyltransferase [Acidovorax sp.]
MTFAVSTPRPRILVLLAAFNGAAFLPEQIASILKQNAVNVHIVLSIDRSNDGTEAWAMQMTQRDPRVSVLPAAGVFGSAAPNFFRLIRDADPASFNYVALADQDDLWHPNKLARACQQLQHTGAAGYSSNVIAFWSNGKEAVIDKAQPQQAWDFLFEGAGPGCTFVLTRQLALELQTWIRDHAKAIQPIGFHDWLIYAWTRAQGYMWMIDVHPHMHYRQHSTNQIGANTGLRAILLRATYIANGWGLGQASLIAQLIGLETHPFVASWRRGQRIGLLRLALNASHCRRRRRDQVLFFLMCLWMAFFLPGRGKTP